MQWQYNGDYDQCTSGAYSVLNIIYESKLERNKMREPTVGDCEQHYENTLHAIYSDFSHPKNDNFHLKIFDFFHIFAQNIDCGYTLEPPRRGGSNEYLQSMF